MSLALIKRIESGKNGLVGDVGNRLTTFCTKNRNIELFESTNKCLLTEQTEKEFFHSIFGSLDTNNSLYVYRYTSYSSFLRILDNMEHSMCSVVGMNDSTERNYFTSYIRKKFYKQMNSMDDYTKNHFLSSNYDNHYYITSLMPKSNCDNLDMWRIYGDDGQGVMLEYIVNKNLLDSSFFLSNVLYETSKDSNGVIKFLFYLMLYDFGGGRHLHLNYWDAWQHMFKPYEYRNEKEIRLLHISKKVDRWVLNEQYGILMPIKLFSMNREKSSKQDYPLMLKRVIFGPKLKERENNKDMLKIALATNGMNDVDIDYSSIYSYR